MVPAILKEGFPTTLVTGVQHRENGRGTKRFGVYKGPIEVSPGGINENNENVPPC